MFVCKHELPKIWQGRVQKYWDKLLPAGYPSSSSTFSTSFKSDAALVAVEKMEDELNTENCIALEAIPENTFVSSYVGVYDVEGTPGKYTLLCPEKVSSENVVVLHYNENKDAWETVKEVEVIDGYVWGKLDSFSPIAVFEYKNDIMIVDGPIVGPHKDCELVVVGNGNPMKVYGEDDKVFVVGPTGVPVEITKKANIIGGSIDGTALESTDVTIEGVKNQNIIARVYGGSSFDNSEEVPFTTVESVNVKVIDSELNLVTGSVGAVRVDTSNVTIKDSKVTNVATGQSMITGIRDASVSGVDPDFSCNVWVKNSNLVVSNSEIELLFTAGNAGNQYTNNAYCKAEDSKIGWFTAGGGSNGKTDFDIAEIVNCEIKVFQTVNRGKVGSVKTKIDNCSIENLYIGGETEDKTVTGTTGSVKLDIVAGTYNIVAGTDGGEVITNNDIVEYIKIYDSEVTISDELVAILGSKYIVK